MFRKILQSLALVFAVTQLNFAQAASFLKKNSSPPGEVIYHIFIRSFYDSNNDLNGDFNGIREKLDYLQDLGITSILITPICESPYYHNYFSSDFEKIDAKYGTTADWINLVEEIHKRGMKIYLDVEFQYVTEDHSWYKDSYGNPKSKYTHYIVYNDSANLKPEPIIFGLTKLSGYDGTIKTIATVNLYDKNAQAYFLKLLKYWMDPNGDGKFNDGVDGFRFDHMMDDLDWKGKLTDLFKKFWLPLINQLKEVNPNLKNVAEQANWTSYGIEYFTNGDVDRVFSFNLQMAIASFDASRIARVADSTFSLTPDKNQQLVFLENHDMDRFSSVVNGDAAKLRIGATLNLLIGGIPDIYYGQELGMKGKGGFGKFGNTDANDILRREAFEWFAANSGKGMALWYKNTGAWWDSTNLKPHDGISLEEEEKDPNSLLNFYKKIIHLRQNNSVLINGKYQTLKSNNDKVLSFLRYENNNSVVVVVNLSFESQHVIIDCTNNKILLNHKNAGSLFGKEKLTFTVNSLSTYLPPYSIDVWEMR